jgi:hypothetical protein
MLNISIGFLVGILTSWVSFNIGKEQQIYKETIKEDLYQEILNERNYYKKFYEREFHRRNSGH